MNFRLNARHYWSYAENISTHLLQEDGSTIPFEYLTNKNSNLNLWNLDCLTAGGLLLEVK